MSIAFDATATGADETTSTDLIYSHTCGGSADLIVITIWTRFSGDVISSVTYGGSSMTRAAATSGAGSRYVYIYYLASPSTGSNDFVVTTTNADRIRAASVSYSGADTTTPLDAAATGSDTNTPITLPLTTTADDVALVGASSAGVYNTAGANTLNWYNLALVALRSNANVATAGATSLEYVPSSPSGANGWVVASFNSSGGGGGGGSTFIPRTIIY